jgi:hypothetical protein
VTGKIKPSDIFVCYLTRLSRWFGLLEVVKGPFIDDIPVFVPEDDPFVVRFRVRPTVWLAIDKGIPIHDDAIWAGLSSTRGLEKGCSLVRLDDQDGIFLTEKPPAQKTGAKSFADDVLDRLRKMPRPCSGSPNTMDVMSRCRFGCGVSRVGSVARKPRTRAQKIR